MCRTADDLGQSATAALAYFALNGDRFTFVLSVGLDTLWSQGGSVVGDGYVETNGTRLWYEDLGDPDGEVVVLVMGATASVIWWPPELLEALTGAGRRVVRFDNRDIGLSTHIDYMTNPYTLDDMAADTVGLLDALGLDRAHFVGASMGGMICQLLAIRHPDRVRSLGLLITTPGPDERLSSPGDEVVAIAMRPVTTDAELEQRSVDLSRALTGSRFPFDEVHHRELAVMDAARGTNPNSAHGIAVFTAPSRLDALAAIGVPTLVVHGTEDPIFPYDHGEVLARAIPSSTFVTWRGVGHEIPAPLSADLIELLQANIAAAR